MTQLCVCVCVLPTFVLTIFARWSRIYSSVATMLISRAPFAIRFKTISNRIYVPVRPTPSLRKFRHSRCNCISQIARTYLQWTIIGDDRPRKHLFTFLKRNIRTIISSFVFSLSLTHVCNVSRQVAFVTMQLLISELHNFQKLPKKKSRWPLCPLLITISKRNRWVYSVCFLYLGKRSASEA